MKKLPIKLPRGGLRRGDERPLSEELGRTQKKLELMRKACFQEETSVVSGYCSQLAAGLANCLEAYTLYLQAAGRYARAKLIRESCFASGKIDYRLGRFQAYVKEELPAADSILAVMSGGWYGCAAPILEEAQALEERLNAWQEEALPGPEVLRKQLLKRYFTNSILFEFIQLPEELEAFLKKLSRLEDKQDLAGMTVVAQSLNARYEKLRDACMNSGSRATLEEVNRVAGELKNSTLDLQSDTARCEELLGRVETYAAQLRALPLRVEAGEDGVYPESPQQLADLKEAYAKAAEMLKEGLRFESHRPGEPEV